jgi:hypothetical protein
VLWILSIVLSINGLLVAVVASPLVSPDTSCIPVGGLSLGSSVFDRVHLRRRQFELVHGEVIGHVLGVGCAREGDHS